MRLGNKNVVYLTEAVDPTYVFVRGDTVLTIATADRDVASDLFHAIAVRLTGLFPRTDGRSLGHACAHWESWSRDAS